jgi:hypothetical protein
VSPFRDSAIALSGTDSEHVAQQLGIDPDKVTYPVRLVGNEFRVELRIQAFSLDTERDPNDRNLKEVTTKKTSKRVRTKSSS